MLTVQLSVAVLHGWDPDEHLLFVPLHRQLQTPARLLYQTPGVTHGQALCYRTVNLHTHTHTLPRTDTHPCMHVGSPECTSTQVPADAVALIASHSHSLSLTHTHTHAHTHTHTHTH